MNFFLNIIECFFIQFLICFSFDYRDLSKISSLKNIILNSFASQSEEVKSAASYTLGNVAVGNLQGYLPFILEEIETQPKRQYLLLHSLKEVILKDRKKFKGIIE